jgi:hypothetical protein
MKNQNAYMKFLWRKTMKASWIQKVVPMPGGSSLRLTNAKATMLKVQTGLVWITEEGVDEDIFLGSGEQYVVQGDGLLIISAESEARLGISEHLSHMYTRISSFLKITGQTQTQGSW